MEGSIEEERHGTLNTEPPPSPLYPRVKDHVAAPEVTASEVAPAEVPEQPLSANAEKEAVASNPPLIVEEPNNEVTSGYIGSHALINLKEEELAADINEPSPA